MDGDVKVSKVSVTHGVQEDIIRFYVTTKKMKGWSLVAR